ncbi:hypothetical protein PybrP1_006372 [[Pythium] brassicae (nom. inval.)]|nr:hypothetical protein PybrP1_006372 [[Pythium] brassicae (nom. inval.)]
MRGNRPPRSTKLLPLYLPARQLADKCGVVPWTHHYRRHNWMTDGLANATMDARATAQDGWPTLNPLLQGVQDSLRIDVDPWYDARCGDG